MESFLTRCRAELQVNEGRFHVVLGNESCDLDSMVSSLSYAYFLCKTVHGGAFTVPLMNVRQSDFVLRSDNVSLLLKTGLSPDCLLFRDQVDLQRLQSAGRLQLTLVDHNVLPSSDSGLEGAVVEVIDHHQLERKSSASCPVTVEMVGSCTTLVTERIVQTAPEIMDQQLAQLLYATILVDCINMAPAAGKATPKDSHYVTVLEERFPKLPPRDVLFSDLQNAKFDVSGLNTEQMLQKDMKTVSGYLNIAVSVIYIALEEFLQKTDLEAELSQFCIRFSLDLLLMMFIRFTAKNEPCRHLAIFSRSATCRKEMSQYLEQARSPTLDLRPISSPHPHIPAYLQGNALASRKKLLPLIKDFLQDGHLGEEAESRLPPTPMNSLVEGCPLDAGPPRISAQALEEKFNKMADGRK